MSEETKAALMDAIARTLLAMEEGSDDDGSSLTAEAGAAVGTVGAELDSERYLD